MFFLQMLINGIVVGSIYGLVALGFVLIYRASGALNLANGEFVLFGPYICLVLMTALNVPFLVAFIGTLIISAILGLVVERLVIRQLQNAPTISVIMATLGLSSLLAGAVHIIWGHTTRTFPPVFPQTPLNLGGALL